MSDPDQTHRQLIEAAVKLLNEEYEASPLFNEYINGDEPFRLGKVEFSKSKVLFWLDREAYEDERTAWENDANQARHQEAAELLRLNGSIVPFQDLIDAVVRSRIVPFIGAGLSKPIGMPLWGEALSLLLNRLPGADASTISALIAVGNYLEAAQLLADHDYVQTTNFIRTTYRAQKINLVGPMLQLPRFAKGCIVTTNFEDAIEKVYELNGVEFKAYMHGTQDHNFFQRMVRGDRCLLKLHGDAENDATHILTKAQYTNAYGDPFDFRKPLPKALRQIYISQSLLFLGCSLDQDWTLELFKRAKQQDEYQIPSHYAILPEPIDAQKKQQKSRTLLELNIQPIWYPDGEHEFVEKLLQLIVDVTEKRVTFEG